MTDSVNTNVQDDTLENDDLDPIAEMDPLVALKARADMMGLKYHHKISYAKLATMVEKAIAGEAEDGLQEDEKTKVEVTRSAAQLRLEQRKQALALVRVNVHCKDPNKKDWPGEIFTVSNGIVGTVRKYVKFDTENGYHVPRIIVDMLKEKQLQQFRSIKHANGMTTREAFLTSAFTIEELKPLTQKELEQLAADQRSRNAID